MKEDKNEHLFSKNKGFKILGIGKQETIKYFFGGNSLIAIIALLLITIFLAKEAILFFPDYRQNLEIYRKSGKEFAEFPNDQLKHSQEIKSAFTQLLQLELHYKAGVEAYIPKTYSAFKIEADKKLKAELLGVKIAKQRISSKEIIWEIWSEGDDQSKKDLAKSQMREFSDKVVKAQQNLTQKCREVVDSITISDIDLQYKKNAFLIQNKNKALIPEIKDALVDFYSNYSKSTAQPQYIIDAEQTSIKVKNEILKEKFFVDLSKREKQLAALTAKSGKFGSYVEEMLLRTLIVGDRAESFLATKDKKKSIEEGIPEATAEKARKLKIDLERLITKDQDYAASAKILTDSLPLHQTLQNELLNGTKDAVKGMPERSAFEFKEAQQRYDTLTELLDTQEALFSDKRTKMENWRWDKKVGYFKTIMGFLLGEKWVANSSWHNFFGFKPLFAGSFYITLIALTIATPFAVGAAIYVNRLASPLEQSIIKPIIEFIQAIPSVVLAFLGVVVVGKFILNLSYNPYLDWVPGFPATREQMMLTVGVLLAFMAIPTMFTLAEDAINNVPKSYNEASLALGASKLQTVFKVIVPCALSGVVAAVLLGFGRIIGETMVVLLVAGGTVDMPETWTSPVHTMTGMIAQSTSEAAKGSIQYRALFLLGLVLFFISLSLNSLAQAVIKKYGNRD